jgi:hypothetical protein
MTMNWPPPVPRGVGPTYWYSCVESAPVPARCGATVLLIMTIALVTKMDARTAKVGDINGG